MYTYSAYITLHPGIVNGVPGRTVMYAGLDHGCVWGKGSWRKGCQAAVRLTSRRWSERRRWEEGAINTQGVCAYLSRTIKWKRYQCSNNGFVRHASSWSFPFRVPTKLHPRWVRHFQRKPYKLCWIHEAKRRKADSPLANRRDQQGLLVMKRTAPFCSSTSS